MVADVVVEESVIPRDVLTSAAVKSGLLGREVFISFAITSKIILHFFLLPALQCILDWIAGVCMLCLSHPVRWLGMAWHGIVYSPYFVYNVGYLVPWCRGAVTTVLVSL